MSNADDYSALKWIKDELDDTIRQARQALEEYAEGSGDADQLGLCSDRLHQIFGTLQMVQLYGPAMLAEEMEQASRAILNGKVRQKSDAVEALMLALVQLPDYLEKLQAGGRDIPLVLLPLLNDLRAARDAPFLTEASLFTPVLDHDVVPDHVTGLPNAEIPELARGLRLNYHRGLLGWYRNVDIDVSLHSIREVVAELARQAGTRPVYHLFWVGHALTEGLLDHSITAGSAVKSLFGKLDREIKRIIDQGEAQLVQSPAVDLLKNMLFYVAQANSDNSEIRAVKDAYQLASALPSEEELDAGRARLSAPNADALNTVREVIKTDLTQIKDNLDLYIRGDRSQIAGLHALEDPMHKLADALGMLGQGALRLRLHRQADRLAEMRLSESPPDETELLKIASEILFVESSLGNVGLAEAETAAFEADLSDAQVGAMMLPSGELGKLRDVALTEAHVEMSKAKDAIVAYIETPEDPGMLAEVPTRFHYVSGALKVLSLAEPAAMLDGAGDYVRREIMGHGQLPSREHLNALADIITSVEYYLETMLERRKKKDEILDIARMAIKTLGLASNSGAAVLQSPVVPAAGEETGAVSGGVEAESGVANKFNAVDAAGSDALVAESGVVPAGEGIDEDILDIFMDEARDELKVIREFLARWRQDPRDLDAVARFRRSFHTLKGSGRLVGAESVGELAWSIENMLNQVIEGSITATPDVLRILDDALEVMPGLVESQKGGGAPLTQVQSLMKRAFAAAEPGLEEEVAETLTGLGPAPGAEETLELDVAEALYPLEADRLSQPKSGLDQEIEGGFPPGFAMEPELFEIFGDEANSHLEYLQAFVRGGRDAREPVALNDGVYRALHTLHGSADMAGAHPIAEVSRALEKLVNALLEKDVAADAAVLETLEEGVAKISEQLAAINSSGAQLPDVKPFVDRANRLRKERLAALAEIKPPPFPAEASPAAEGQAGMDGEAIADAPSAGMSDQSEATPEDLGLAPAGPDAEAGAIGGDEELIGIFLEEARELLDNLDVALSHWRRSPGDNAPVADLQRTLHTLKGGARLAGITAVGDLGHAFESLLMGVTNDEIAVSEEIQDLAQKVADRLSAQVDEVGEHTQVHPASDLLGRLDAVLAGAARPPLEAEEKAPTAAEDVLSETSIGESTGVAAKTAAGEGITREEKGLAEKETAETARMASPEEELGPQPASEPETAEEAGVFSGGVGQEPGTGTLEELPLAAKKEMEPVAAPALKTLAQPAAGEVKLPPKREQVRVQSDLLDRLVNNAGEVSIYRARLEQQNSAIGFNLSELEQTVTRLRRQLRQLEIETEAQILFRYEREKEASGRGKEKFDPLELDRFSNMQQLSRGLMETVNDLGSIKDITEDLNREMETLLLQQSRISTDLQDGLLRTRMVPFTQVVSRLQRVVRQTCGSTHKQAALSMNGAEVEVDRTILERIIAPLEHILRNAVSHGIEHAQERRAQGKDAQGRITLDLIREGTDAVLTVADDGEGLNLDDIRKRAIEKGLLREGADVADTDIMQFILESGFSTAAKVSQISGRGVGMDVVASEVKQLGGSLEIESQRGSGTSFTIRLPLTLAISEALLVQMEEDIYAVPHTSIEGVVRIRRQELKDCYEGRQEGFEYAGHAYLVRCLGSMLGLGAIALPEGKKWFPLLLVRSGDRRVALQVDGLLGNRQIVVKSVGPQLSTVRWITGGTILGDGSVALILDVNALVRMDAANPLAAAATEHRITTEAVRMKVMVVDDSITVRKVTGRLLERYNFQVITAKDGVDAVALLQEHAPDVMLLDIEMPRMDGFELARHMQSSPDLRDIPIIMITSRTGEKHRKLAEELGVRSYLGKPYQEMELLDNIYAILAEADA